MKKWEYKTRDLPKLSYGLTSMDKKLNDWGKDGWEICGCYCDNGKVIYTLKREL